ncbi:MAG: hypothetical protein ABJE95_39400 [Byssovorax sp.]
MQGSTGRGGSHRTIRRAAIEREGVGGAAAGRATDVGASLGVSSLAPASSTQTAGGGSDSAGDAVVVSVLVAALALPSLAGLCARPGTSRAQSAPTTSKPAASAIIPRRKATPENESGSLEYDGGSDESCLGGRLAEASARGDPALRAWLLLSSSSSSIAAAILRSTSKRAYPPRLSSRMGRLATTIRADDPFERRLGGGIVVTSRLLLHRIATESAALSGSAAGAAAGW